MRSDLVLVFGIAALEVFRSARSAEALPPRAELLGLLESAPLIGALHAGRATVQMALAARSQQPGSRLHP